MAESAPIPLLEHEPSEAPVFTAANLLEAAALLALGAAIGKPVVCLAHTTNAMATRGEDFEKGGKAGLEEALSVCALTLRAALEHAAQEATRKGGGRKT
ncbi:MAG: hypothetical protein M1550_00170 [Deltaproteobacteria bacterium]|nr:hypothetical protein [Deltaproteobacteria bacterium]